MLFKNEELAKTELIDSPYTSISDSPEARLVTFGDTLCAYFKRSKEILRFNGQKKLESIELPELVGDYTTMSA